MLIHHGMFWSWVLCTTSKLPTAERAMAATGSRKVSPLSLLELLTYICYYLRFGKEPSGKKKSFDWQLTHLLRILNCARRARYLWNDVAVHTRYVIRSRHTRSRGAAIRTELGCSCWDLFEIVGLLADGTGKYKVWSQGVTPFGNLWPWVAWMDDVFGIRI
jgi:hypothetical protein